MSRKQVSGQVKTIAVIPSYNEEKSVGRVVKEASRFVDEVVVIDDGSKDATAQQAESAGATVLRHRTNSGIGSSLKTGYDYCLSKPCDITVQLDADGQHDPKFIPAMISYLVANNLDIVTGSRFLGQGGADHPMIRRAGIKVFSLAAGFFGSGTITDVTSGFRAYRTSALSSIRDLEQRHWAMDQTLRSLKLGLRYGEIRVQMPPRNTGKSQFNAKTFFLYPPRMMKVIIRVGLSGVPKSDIKKLGVTNYESTLSS